MDLEAMAIKGFSASPKLQHYESLTIRLFWVISRTLVGVWVLLICRDAISVFYSPSRQWKCIPHFLKFQHYKSLTIRLFTVISRTLSGGGLILLQGRNWCILQSPLPNNWPVKCWIALKMFSNYWISHQIVFCNQFWKFYKTEYKLIFFILTT